MKMLIKGLMLACLLAALAACQSHGRKAGDTDAVREATPFVTVEGDRFYRNGQPYYFVGTNFWYGAYLGATDRGRERLRRELDILKAHGVTNLRVLAASEKTTLTMAVSPAIHEAPGQYNEALLQGLDVLLDEMAQRDMQAVLYFNNFWQWSGGMAQYLSWLTGEPPFDPDTTGNWVGFMDNSAAFYRSETAQGWYRDLIRAIVTRTNTVNGKLYAADPTVMSWQLANEPRPGSDEYGRAHYTHFKNWIRDTSRFIKTLAPHQLVSTGNEGAMGTLGDIALYQDSHDMPEVDYLTFHMWPKNWRWFDITRPEETYDAALARSKTYVLQHIQVAQALNKPIVMSEFGIERDNGDYRLSSGTHYRDRFYREIFNLVENQAKAGAPIAGSNFWTWGGLGRAQSDDMIWREGDPFTGDPPQEHQGLNSVFDVDTSTLGILRAHSQVMRRIR